MADTTCGEFSAFAEQCPELALADMYEAFNRLGERDQGGYLRWAAMMLGMEMREVHDPDRDLDR